MAVAVARQVQEVDNSINVLMSAGMSSPALRNVAAAGVNIATGLYWLEWYLSTLLVVLQYKPRTW